MNEAVKLILSLSISGSILAAVLFAIKPLIRHRLPKSLQYYVWLIVLLRLLIPFSFEESIMNNMFYKESILATAVSAQGEAKMAIADNKNAVMQSSKQDKTSEAKGVQLLSPSKIEYVKTLIKQSIIYIWLIGVLAVLAVNLSGYFGFVKCLNKANKPAYDKENIMLERLVGRKRRIKLVRNPFAATPMVIGIIRPCIVIPDNQYSENQLENILLHETAHMRRFDIVIKWMTAVACAMHWFNPMMCFIKEEINAACELSCDEEVIKNLNAEGRQDYGETLISVAAEHKYPAGLLSATMCEEKKNLKERLVSIMKHSKESRLVKVISVLLIFTVLCGAVVLGAGVGISSKNPPNVYISTEFQKTKGAITGGYSWKYGTTQINADADHPKNFKYGPENTVSVGPGEQFILGTQRIKADKKYNFTLGKIEVYKNNQPVELADMDHLSYYNSSLYLQAPKKAGEYVYCIILDFGDKGTVNYGFVVRVGTAAYNLTEIEKYKTPYIGNHSKVLAIVGRLPVPDNSFRQQYISMKTSSTPYNLTVYYESASENGYSGEWPIDASNTNMNINLQKNALVLFCMIGNLDEVTFAFRATPSEGDLDTSKYDSEITFSRENIEKIYGNIERLSQDINILKDILN